MNKEQAQAIYDEYKKYDDLFRAAKKRGYHKQAAAHKAKRDVLAGKFAEAVKVLKEKE